MVPTYGRSVEADCALKAGGSSIHFRPKSAGISPHDLFYEVEKKVEEYFSAGVKLVWVINPDVRIISVYQQNSPHILRLREDDELTGGEVLPGFTFKVSELFARADY